jgi:hypothetical protein
VSDGDDSLLATLVGEEQASVIFVRDYVELDFDGPGLSMFVWPNAAIGARRHRMGDPGCRDALY